MTDTPKKKPTHTAYTVRDFVKDKETGELDSSWLKIGVAFLHKNGKGFDVILEALPVNGRIVLTMNEPKKKTEAKTAPEENTGPEWQQ